MAPSDHDDGSRDFVATGRHGNVWFGTYRPDS